MSKRSYKPEEIVAKLRQVDVLHSQGSTIADAIRQIGVSEVTFYRWRKEYGGMGSLYRSQHEFVFVFKNGSARHINNVELGRHGRHRSNVWTYPGVNTFRDGRLEELALHPTPKPVQLVADALLDCSNRNGIVLDSFAGSGTTIIAAERTGRQCYAIELDPIYIDTAIRRWQDFTGGTATHVETGLTFAEMAERRSDNAPTEEGASHG
jgi:DNA modification methylase